MSAPAAQPPVDPAAQTVEPRAPARSTWRARAVEAAPVLCIIIAGLVLLAPGLGHPYIHDWDECAHQAAARGTYESFFRPHIHDVEVFPQDLDDWMDAGVFLHKPTGALWFAAIVMHLIGVTPLALRLGSLFGLIAAAICVHLLVRRIVGAVISTSAAVALLALPFAYQLCQGYIFGDATDCTLLGWVTTAMVLLVAAVERDDARWAAAAGAATGLAYLCKTALGLTPLGVAFVFAVLGSAKWVKPLRWKLFGLFCLALALVAVPWNVYTALAFPAVYRHEAAHTIGHLFTHQVAQWVRPADAIVNEINETELGPIPTILPVLALLWASVRAVRRRETAVVALVLWVGATWLVLSIALVKVPATAWGAVAGALALLGILFFDAGERPALFGALAGGAVTIVVLRHWPRVASVAHGLPQFLTQTRTHPQLAVGALLAGSGAVLAAFATRLLRTWSPPRQLGPALASALAVLAIIPITRAQGTEVAALSQYALIAPMRELGLALGRVLPKKSVIFLQVDRDARNTFNPQDLMFWSGRNAYHRAPDLAAAAAHGVHPYLVTVASEPYLPVPVPAFAAARAYDLLAPAPPAGLPPDLTPLSIKAGGARVLGFASGERDASHDVWAFYLHATGSFSVPVEFETGSTVERARLDPAATLSNPERWAGKPWFEVTVVGPRRSKVRALRVGTAELALGS